MYHTDTGLCRGIAGYGNTMLRHQLFIARKDGLSVIHRTDAASGQLRNIRNRIGSRHVSVLFRVSGQNAACRRMGGTAFRVCGKREQLVLCMCGICADDIRYTEYAACQRSRFVRRDDFGFRKRFHGG